MRIPALTLAVALLLAAAPARGQDALPPEIAQRVTATLNDAATDRRSGATRIAADQVITGNLAVVEGDLDLAGRVDGDVVVLNGALTLQAGARVGGRVVVTGGGVQQAPGSRVSGEIATFADPVEYCQRGVRIDVDPAACRTARPAAPPAADASAPAADSVVVVDDGGTGSAGPARDSLGYVIAAGRSYNRVEGLTLGLGGRYRRGGTNPTRLRAIIITRSEEGPQLGPERWGYDVRAEQFVGGTQRVRIGARAFSVIDPIEDWHLTDVENSLATFFLHRDYRDYYERQGWSASAGWGADDAPLRGTLEYRSERHRPVAAGSPFTLFDNAEPWRAQPLAAPGHLSSLVASGIFDTRSEALDPSSGWLIRGMVEQTLNSTLRIDGVLATDESNNESPAEADYGAGWTSAVLDVRRYNRISPSSRLNLRVAAGGVLGGGTLPAQRQHAMGGEGSLPGFGLFELDCGARGGTVRRGTGNDAPTWYLRYGCSRFVTLQAEWRGDLAFGVDFRGGNASGEGAADEEWSGSSLPDFAADLGWVVFSDLGAGWSQELGYRDEDTAIDVGAGITFGDFGVYAAIPIFDKYGRGGWNIFVRLAPRF